MVWKMLFEEFHDGSLMLCPHIHLDGKVSGFQCHRSACCLQSSFCSRGYMVWKIMMFDEFQDGCLVLRNL